MKPNKATQWMTNMKLSTSPLNPLSAWREGFRLWIYPFSYKPILMFIIILLAIPYSLFAQDEAPIDTALETLRTLQTTHIPQNDPINLAYRFYEVEAPPAPVQTIPYQRGDQDEFWVSDNNSGTTRRLNATLEAVGQFAYFWIEDGEPVNEDDLHDLAVTFDAEIYTQVRDIWGSEPLLGVDGDARLHILFARGLGASTAAYFARRHNYPEAVLAHSNAREMFFVNLSNIPTVNSSFLQSTLAHEFQHMIRANTTPNEDAWLNEGFSTFTEGYLGYEAAGRYPNEFLREPDTQLTVFGVAPNRLAEYGAGYLFVNYLYDRFGLEAVQALSNNPLNGMFGVDEVTQAFGNVSSDEFFADWVVANLVQDGRWELGYQQPRGLMPPHIHRASGKWFNTTQSLSQYATHYYELADAEDYSQIEIVLSLPDIAQLVPIEAYSGEKFWYSNRGDISHTRLYREFDLTAVTSATLTYQLWANLEEQWDYGYLLISTDSGATWQTLQTEHMTTDNRLGNLYGEAGYSFSSHKWLKEQIILDEFVGQKVIISFELITDDAINYEGMVLDDIAIPEIDYYADFETDNGGWISEGWVWVTNQIPQQAWVQVIQYYPTGIQIDRWLLPNNPTISIGLLDDVESVVMAISPIAPVTTVPTNYELAVELRND